MKKLNIYSIADHNFYMEYDEILSWNIYHIIFRSIFQNGSGNSSIYDMWDLHFNNVEILKL